MTNYRKNYLSGDKLAAINSYGEVFEINDTVKHDGAGNETAKILNFKIDETTNEIIAETTRGTAHIDFLTYIEETINN